MAVEDSDGVASLPNRFSSRVVLAQVQTICCSRASGGLSFSFFCIFVRRRIMPRTGWPSVPVPDGWLQVIRGPRPKSEQWPQQSRLPAAALSVGTPRARGRWRSGDSHVRRGEPNSVTALKCALIVLGPEDGAVREGLEAALRRAKDKAKVATPSRAPVPEVTFEAA